MQIFFNIILIQSRFSLVSESESFCISKCALPVSRVSISNSSKSFQLHDRPKRIFFWISRLDQDKGLTWNNQGDLIDAISQVLAISNIFIEQSQNFTFPSDWMFCSFVSVNDLTTSIDQEIGEVPWNSLISTCFGG